MLYYFILSYIWLSGCPTAAYFKVVSVPEMFESINEHMLTTALTIDISTTIGSIYILMMNGFL